MKVALFIPCYINQFYPQVAIATLEILEKLQVEVSYPMGQVCCGQPMANAGFQNLTEPFTDAFLEQFDHFDYVVCPSGSCTLHLKEHVNNARDNERHLGRIFELTEFLTDVIGVAALPARFPHRVALHQSCHGLRGLRLARASELVESPFSKPEKLLRLVDGLTVVEPSRPDECCGFGGLFSIGEDAVSVRMGTDRIEDFAGCGAEYITSGDMSCLMHLEGILRRQNSAIQTIHIAEILNAR